MAWTLAEAARLLGEAFPWGAHVTVAGDGGFVSLNYQVDSIRVADRTAELSFVREPGDTFFTATSEQLRMAAATGVLDVGTHMVRRPEPADMHLLSSPFTAFVGPQSNSDPPWAARMRLHQSWWRAFRLRAPFGFG